jgi:purine-binding chemotaxis protein CheW
VVADSALQSVLVVAAGSRRCALPLDGVDEVLRPLATQALPGSFAALRGLSVIRGAALPVIDLAALLDGDLGRPERFVVVDCGQRRAALAVESVPGLRLVRREAAPGLSSLFEEARGGLVAGVSVTDQDLLWILNLPRLIPDGLWNEFRSGDAGEARTQSAGSPDGAAMPLESDAPIDTHGEPAQS